MNNKYLKIVTAVVILLFSTKIKAQEKFNTYENSFVKKTFQISISGTDTTKFSLYIDAFSFDKINSDGGGITIKESHYQNFTDAILEAKGKYEEWVKTAIENNVKELDKEMNISSIVDGYFLYGRKWNFQFGVFLKFQFRVREIGGKIEHILLVKTGELQSSSNRFMKVDGFALIFSSAKEIDDFLTKISMSKIKEFQNKPKKEDLFKD